mmetsp:Transcript_88687/g.185386  ORF Transcript_88687/g.185386 Transcript_88687/m.185386 type:complete len:84 (+) Transcript_88687:625-876(+)
MRAVLVEEHDGEEKGKTSAGKRAPTCGTGMVQSFYKQHGGVRWWWQHAFVGSCLRTTGIRILLIRTYLHGEFAENPSGHLNQA